MITAATDRKILLTRKGLKDLRKSIAQLEHERQRTIQNLREGDKSFDRDGRLRHIEQITIIENLDDEINEKRLILKQAVIVPKHTHKTHVNIGSKVELVDEKDQLRQFTIVNSFEANPSHGRISDQSPLGRSLIGKTVRDIIEYRCGNMNCMWRLVKIS